MVQSWHHAMHFIRTCQSLLTVVEQMVYAQGSGRLRHGSGPINMPATKPTLLPGSPRDSPLGGRVDLWIAVDRCLRHTEGGSQRLICRLDHLPYSTAGYWPIVPNMQQIAFELAHENQ